MAGPYNTPSLNGSSFRIMMRVSQNFSDTMQKKAFLAESTNVIFTLSHFPKYKIGPNNHITNVKGDPKVCSMKEIVAHETAFLMEQQNCLFVCNLDNKFEKGLIVAAKLSKEAKLREATSLGKHVCSKKLKDALES
ncbi:hypothetical protein J1N35_013766 [Gossypium stocksii]|uniref:Stomatal closure-related actin-binding protein actin-binding domain-containing protein n=1 Tax=Gossypium stocksii TaxID=47602 RepID=A0A9D4A866_9ROSI|nr:hypothetical protein J1N35_013766 [Gossypium stocksii]